MLNNIASHNWPTSLACLSARRGVTLYVAIESLIDLDQDGWVGPAQLF